MESRRSLWWLGLALAILLGVGVGCSGVLQEVQHDDGSVERLKVQGGESWKTWDRNATKGEDSAFILKKESTF
jgi:hypothetical protein